MVYIAFLSKTMLVSNSSKSNQQLFGLNNYSFIVKQDLQLPLN